jgi:hypothetical protein
MQDNPHPFPSLIHFLNIVLGRDLENVTEFRPRHFLLHLEESLRLIFLEDPFFLLILQLVKFIQ